MKHPHPAATWKGRMPEARPPTLTASHRARPSRPGTGLPHGQQSPGLPGAQPRGRPFLRAWAGARTQVTAGGVGGVGPAAHAREDTSAAHYPVSAPESPGHLARPPHPKGRSQAQTNPTVSGLHG